MYESRHDDPGDDDRVSVVYRRRHGDKPRGECFEHVLTQRHESLVAFVGEKVDDAVQRPVPRPERDERVDHIARGADRGRALPPADGDLDDYLELEHRLGRVLDYAVIQPRLRRLYDWSALELGRPELSGLLFDGGPGYAWPPDDRAWKPPRLALTVRALATVTAAR